MLLDAEPSGWRWYAVWDYGTAHNLTGTWRTVNFSHTVPDAIVVAQGRLLAAAEIQMLSRSQLGHVAQ